MPPAPSDSPPSDRTAPALSRRDFVRATAAAGAAVGLAPWVAACDRRPRLNVYMWSDYIAPETVPDFERETGIRVTVDTYESNAEMLAKLFAGAQGYDILFPTSYLLPSLVEAGLLLQIPDGALANRDNIAPMFQAPSANPHPDFAVPYEWGTSGIAWRRDKLATPPDSWGVFLDPAYAGTMTMMDDAREVLGAMLRYRGHSVNSTDPGQLQQAKTDALAARPNLLAYISAPVRGQIVAGDVWVAQMWNGDAAQAAAESPEISYAVPREGSSIWMDTMAIPSNAPNVREALQFLDYMLRPEVAARNATVTGYGTANAPGTALLADPVPYPTAEELTRLEFYRDLGEDTQLYYQIWTEVKAG
ncbi:MAG: spermidine/putrescine ABC transporter substrate-binding protein [Gemmatimonadales bacterium]